MVTDVARLLPLVNNRALSRDDQRYVVSQFFGVASDGCALILQSGGDAFDALELLELTRGSIIRLLMDDRSDMSALRQSCPRIATEYERLRAEVNTPIHDMHDTDGRSLPAIRRLEAVRELDQCIHKIRNQPALQCFLLGPIKKEL